MPVPARPIVSERNKAEIGKVWKIQNAIGVKNSSPMKR